MILRMYLVDGGSGEWRSIDGVNAVIPIGGSYGMMYLELPDSPRD